MSRSVILIASLAILVLPVPVSAQAPTSQEEVGRDGLAVEMADATFDLRTDDGETVAGPGFMDLTMFGVRVDGEDLLISLEVAGDVGEALSTSLHPEYWLWVTLPGTSWHSRFYALPAEDWSIAQQLDIWQRERIGTAEAEGSRIEFRVPRSTLIAPEKLRFAASMAASDLWRSLPDVRAFRDADEASASMRPSSSPAPSGPPLVELEWRDLFDQIPNSASTAIAWLSLDGEVAQYDDLESVESPLTGSVAAKRVLGQRARDISAPTQSKIRGLVSALFEEHGAQIAAMPAFDGIGQLDDATMFDELLGLMRTGDRRLVEAGDQHRSRLWAAAAATAASIYIAERATDPGLEAAAVELADAFHDHALRRIERQRQDDVKAAQRRAFRGMARDILVGFAW